jgi:CheY-like chemotaxis protein
MKLSVTATGTILLIDDDGDVREAIALFLRKRGFSVRTADHGLDALRKLQEHEAPAVIVVDLMMPIMDGWDFLEKCPAGIPIVVVSALDEVHKAKAHPDVRAVLQKPVSMDDLSKAVGPFVTAG